MSPVSRRARQLVSLFWLALVFLDFTRAQQPVTFQYIYDDLNQLIKVVDSTGIVIQYVYDPVGNILQVNRSTVTPGVLAIFGATPQTAGQGGTITIQGQGFSATPALDIVTIGGVTVTVVSATSTALLVMIPSNGVTGTLSVTVGTTTATSDFSETVLPAPVISSVTPNYAVPSITVSLVVTGANLEGSQFSFVPSGNLKVVSTSVNGATSANITVMVLANSVGTYALADTTVGGSSSSLPAPANLFRVLNPLGDEDFDGLTNAQEVALGTDPFNPDTDGDGYIDGVEVAAGSDPKNPLSTPLTVTPNREVIGGALAMLNLADPSTGASPDPSISIREARGSTFALLNTADPSTGASPDPSISILEAVGASIAVQNTAGSSVSGAFTSTLVGTASSRLDPASATGTNALRVSITSPVPGDVLREGQTILVSASAALESSLVLSVNGVRFATRGKMLFTVPHGERALAFRAVATDGAGRSATSEDVTVMVEPDAHTTVKGRVVDADGQPVAGTTVTLDLAGLIADFYQFKTPLTTVPDLAARKPDFTTVVSAVNLRNPDRMFGSDPYGTGIAGDVAARFQGQVFIERSGEYSFTLGAREGGRLMIAGTTVVDMPFGDGTFRERSATVRLGAGWIPIEILHYQNLGDGEIQLSVAAPGLDPEVIGPGQLRASPPAFLVTTDPNGAFEISDVPVALGVLSVNVEAVIGGDRESAVSPAFRPLAGVPVDTGTIFLTRGEQR